MSTQQYLIDAATRHQVFLQRYAGGEANKAMAGLTRIRNEITTRIEREPTRFQAVRLQAVLFDIENLLSVGFNQVYDSVRVGAVDLAISESQFSVNLFNKASTADFVLPASASLVSAVDNLPMVPNGVNLNQSLREFGATKYRQITQAIRDGVVLGDTTEVISRKVRTLIDTLHKRQIAAIVKTATNHASSVARLQTYQTNRDLLDGYEWVSTLDSKTTLICAGYDGEVYQVGQGPLPPAHWNCRSTTIPKIKQEYSAGSKVTGDRPSIGDSGTKRVGANTTYGGWLKKQSKEFIDEALGHERSKLFRSGKLTIDKFTDPTGRVYTLAELQLTHNISL